MFKRKSAVAVALAVVVLAMAASVGAWSHTGKAYLTFSGPFALPGVTLPAGTYIFERVDVVAPNLVRVRNRDGSKVYLTAFTHIISRPAGLRRDAAVSFAEVPAGVAPRVAVWYPTGDVIGHEFIYASRAAGTR
jgi:hypothetical protein